MAFDDLDPLLHSQLRLSIMSLLISVKEADFTFLQEKTEATSGNLSVQITKLEEAGYLKVNKAFKNKKPNTSCRITKKGIEAFEEYVETLQQYIGKQFPEK
jgi:DNA-binding transcriptional ArsR family regulator